MTSRTVFRSSIVFMALAAPLPALAGADAGAGPVLAKARAALGVNHQRAETVRATGDANYRGADVPFALVFHADGRYLAEFGGPLPLVMGYDGEVSWERESGSPDRVTVLGDRDNALLSNWFVTGAWAAADSPLEFTLAPEAGDGAVALAFTIEGSPVEGLVELSRAGMLPVRAVWSAGAETWTQEMSDYRAIGGFALPASVVQKSTNGEPISVRITAAEPLPACDAGLFAMRDAAPADTSFRADASSVIEVKRAPTGHLLVHPTLGRRDLGWFIFDTGAGANVLSTPIAEEAGYERFGSITALGVGGTTQAHFYRAPDLTLGPVTIRDAVFVGIDLSFLDQHMGVPVAGVLGYELLSRVVAEFDISSGAISIHDPSTYKRAGAVWEPLLLYQRHPCIRARFEGGEGVFNLDTGAAQDWVSFHTAAIERLGLLEGRDTAPTRIGGVGGSLPARRGVIEWFEFGGKRTQGVQATFATESQGAYADAYLTGSVGGRLMAPFVLVLDYPSRRVAFVERAD